MQCCTQIPQAIPILINPLTWVLVLAALTSASTLGKKKK